MKRKKSFILTFLVLIMAMIFATESFSEHGQKTIQGMIPNWVDGYIWLDWDAVNAWGPLDQCSGCVKINQMIKSTLGYMGMESTDHKMYIHGAFPFNELRMVTKWIAFLHTDYNPEEIKSNLSKHDVNWQSLNIQNRQVPVATREFGQTVLIPKLMIITQAFNPQVMGTNMNFFPPDPGQYPDLPKILNKQQGSMLQKSNMQNALKFQQSNDNVFVFVVFGPNIHKEFVNFFNAFPVLEGLKTIFSRVNLITIGAQMKPNGVNVRFELHTDSAEPAQQLNEMVNTIRSVASMMALSGNPDAKDLKKYLAFATNSAQDSYCQIEIQLDLRAILMFSDLIDFVFGYFARI